MKNVAGMLVLALLIPWIGRAEDPVTPTKFYTLHFVVQEVDGTRVANSREYSTIAAADSAMDCSIRTSSQVPVVVTQGASSQFQTYDIGVSIDVSRLREVESNVSLNGQGGAVQLAWRFGTEHHADC